MKKLILLLPFIWAMTGLSLANDLPKLVSDPKPAPQPISIPDFAKQGKAITQTSPKKQSNKRQTTVSQKQTSSKKQSISKKQTTANRKNTNKQQNKAVTQNKKTNNAKQQVQSKPRTRQPDTYLRNNKSKTNSAQDRKKNSNQNRKNAASYNKNLSALPQNNVYGLHGFDYDLRQAWQQVYGPVVLAAAPAPLPSEQIWAGEIKWASLEQVQAELGWQRLVTAYLNKDVDELLDLCHPRVELVLHAPWGSEGVQGKEHLSKAASHPELDRIDSLSLRFERLDIDAENGQAFIKAKIKASGRWSGRQMTAPATLNALLLQEDENGDWLLRRAVVNYQPEIINQLEDMLPSLKAWW